MFLKKKKTDNLSQIRERSENQVREPAGAFEFLVLFEIKLIVDVSRFGGEHIKNATVEHLTSKIATVEILFEDGLIEFLERRHRESLGQKFEGQRFEAQLLLQTDMGCGNDFVVVESQETHTIRQILDSIVDIDSVETQVSVRSNLVLIIVESLESWVIDAVDEKGNPVAPVLSCRVDDSNVLYVSKVRSQVKQGNSGDGQMIVNTGLLPLFSGAACMIYGGGTYPNFAHLYNESIIVDACGNRAWNQPVMTERYGYKSITTASADEDYKNDEETMGLAIAYLDSLTEPYCMQIITYSTHAPFTQVDTKGLFLHKDMPSNLQNYMQSVHYADSCIGLLLKKMESDSLFRNTSLVITGDHTFFKKQMLNEYQSFVQKHTDNYPIPADESFCPLIVCSPAIKKSMVVNDLCYQMDIFPTILQCIGADVYYWKGFGENLIDSVALNNRRLVEDEASLLSDKMIRSDYFGSYWRKQ